MSKFPSEDVVILLWPIQRKEEQIRSIAFIAFLFSFFEIFVTWFEYEGCFLLLRQFSVTAAILNSDFFT